MALSPDKNHSSPVIVADRVEIKALVRFSLKAPMTTTTQEMLWPLVLELELVEQL